MYNCEDLDPDNRWVIPTLIIVVMAITMFIMTCNRELKAQCVPIENYNKVDVELFKEYNESSNEFVKSISSCLNYNTPTNIYCEVPSFRSCYIQQPRIIQWTDYNFQYYWRPVPILLPVSSINCQYIYQW